MSGHYAAEKMGKWCGGVLMKKCMAFSGDRRICNLSWKFQRNKTVSFCNREKQWGIKQSRRSTKPTKRNEKKHGRNHCSRSNHYIVSGSLDMDEEESGEKTVQETK